MLMLLLLLHVCRSYEQSKTAVNFVFTTNAGSEINFFRQAPTVDWPFFSVAKWENVGNQLWNSGRQCKIFSRIGDQESAISNPEMCDFLFFSSLCLWKCCFNFFCFCQVTCMQTLKKVRKQTTTLPCKETSFVFRATLNLEQSAVANLREQMTQGPLDDKVDIVINVKQLLCKTRYSCCKTILLYIVKCSQHCVTG